MTCLFLTLYDSGHHNISILGRGRSWRSRFCCMPPDASVPHPTGLERRRGVFEKVFGLQWHLRDVREAPSDKELGEAQRHRSREPAAWGMTSETAHKQLSRAAELLRTWQMFFTPLKHTKRTAMAGIRVQHMDWKRNASRAAYVNDAVISV